MLRHKLSGGGLAKRNVVVPSDVPGEGEVLGAQNADGELPLEKWLATIIAAGCADEYIDDPHARHASDNVQGDDDAVGDILRHLCTWFERE